jgi:hypothetical protein
MRVLTLLLIIVELLMLPVVSFAQPGGRGWHGGGYEGMPYGQFCPGPRWGGPYGVRKPIRTIDEAKQVMERYFSGCPHKMTVGKIEEKEGYFVAEIRDPDGNLIDKTIVDKRTGRIRSIY